MSTVTKKWTPELIREVMASLDQKTGLDGASLSIQMGNAERRLGCYKRNAKSGSFAFSKLYLNDPEFRESEAIQLIRHEYAHYYVHAADLRKYFPIERNTHHGEAWKFACKMVGAVAQRRYDSRKALPDINAETASQMMHAEDVRECNICEFLKRWGRLPLTEAETEYRNLILKKYFTASAYYEIGEECFHRKKGFGKVIDTYPEPEMQWLYVQYVDGTCYREHFLDVFKISNGIILASKYELDAIGFSFKGR